MLSTIVVGTSLSENSTRTLCCLRGLRAGGARKVFLVHAMNIRDVGTLFRQLQALALPALERQAQLLRDMGFEVETDVRLGLPYYEIQQVASEQDASVIAVHLTTESLLESAFVGGVAYEVIQRADRPVLAMKATFTEQGCEPLCENTLDHILFPTDFSANAERALDLLADIVAVAHSTVTVVHVREGDGDTPASEVALDADRQRLSEIAARLTASKAQAVNVVIRCGSPTAELLSISTLHAPSMIIMGSQGAGFIREVFLGSVSHNLVRHAPVPVLLVPAFRG
ncbi:universal stress protein [Planctellipticum variicoloris]|uniref:universal stress protein n=1 Tax=Planctellipticum variicoloris TaxID=3064265 RepID=UPI003013CDA5|nr:universal stress protein [Planctomycetaceae bacterium SH412]